MSEEMRRKEAEWELEDAASPSPFPLHLQAFQPNPARNHPQPGIIHVHSVTAPFSPSQDSSHVSQSAAFGLQPGSPSGLQPLYCSQRL
ncbi:MAG: hypothetical protein Q9211_005483 [Gyalolechia sp. 1 TL-2023]